MITIRQNTAWGLRGASRILLLCIIHATYAVATEPRPAKIAIAEGRYTRLAHLTPKTGFRVSRDRGADSPPQHLQNIPAQGRAAPMTDLRFTHLTSSDGLSQDHVYVILQDHRGFMWFATEDGLNRYDGNAFVVYKNNPNDPGSLGANFIQDVLEDDHGYLWVAAFPGVNKFDPATERTTRYPHDPNNPNSPSGDSVESIARDSRGFLWFATSDGGLDKFDPVRETFTHYRNDSDGKFVGKIDRVIEDSHGEIWFVGERGLFHLNQQTGQIAHPPGTMNGLSAGYLYEDNVGSFWMLARTPIVGLVKYDRRKEQYTEYPVGSGAVEISHSRLLDDGGNGLWVPSSLGLYYFDLRTERFTYRFRHDETNPDSLSDNSVVQIYRDRAGLLWVGTEDGGVNILNFQQEQFGRFMHRPGDPNSLSPGRVTAIYEDPGGVLWVGFFPRALDRLDRKTGRITHYIPDPENPNALGKGSDLNSIYKDARGYLWLGGWGAGVDRLDERTGQFKHYRHNPGDPGSLISDNVLSVYGDRSGRLWVGHQGGVSLCDPETGRFTNFRLGPNTWESSVSAIYQDRSGMLWLGTWDGVLSRFDDKTKTFVNYMPDSRDPHKLQGGYIGAIHEDRAGTLWVGTSVGVCRYNRQNETFTRYAESQDLPTLSNYITGLLEDATGRLWLGTKKGISRLDPQTGTFRHYDVSDGLAGNEFYSHCYQQGQNGEMLFCGSKGITAFFPENIRDNPNVPPVVITSFKIFNKPVPIGPESVLKKAIPYVDSLTLSYRDSVFSFEFAALSCANPRKNRYRYKLEGLEPGWNEVGSTQRLGTYTNLDPGSYVFRVQGSNSDGVWNEEGVSLPILITPPWWRTNWFRALCAAILLAALWAAYQFRVYQLQRESKQLRDVIDTIPGSVWSALPDGSLDFINRRWLEFSGVSLEEGLGRGREAAVHPDDLARFVDEWRAAVACGKAMESEARVRRADGQYRWLLIRNVPLHDQGGKIVKWYGTSTDIDDRKRAEDALRRLNRELRAISNCNQSLLRATDEQSLLEEICRIVCGEAGYRIAWVAYAEHDEAKSVRPVAWAGNDEGYLAAAGITWADTERGRGPTGTAIRTGKSCCIQDFAADPRFAPWLESALQHGFRSGIGLPLKDEDANAFGSLTIHSAQPNAFTPEEIRLLEELAADLAFGIVTLRSRAARKRAEEALRESETRFRTFVDHAADALFIYDFEQGTIVDVNRQACESLGYTRQELIGTTPLAFDRDVDRAATESIAEWTAAGETVIDTHWHQRKDGTLFPVEAHTSQYRYGGRRFLLKVARDISDRLRAEEERAYLASIVESSDDAIIGRSMEGSIQSWNRGAERLYGYTAQEAIGQPIAMVIPPDRAQEFVSSDRLKRGEPIQELETVRVGKDGRRIDVSVIISPMKDAAGRVFGAATIARDITERKRAEAALRQSEAYLAEGQRLSHTGSWAFDLASNKYIYVSEENFRIFEMDAREGLPNREVISRHIHPEDWDRVNESFEKALREKVDTLSEFRVVLPSGTVKHLQVIRHPVMNDAGDVVELVGTLIDMTERKRAEQERERLRQLEADLAHINRVSMMGELAASIAHEVNQPIAAAITSANACLRWLAHDPPDLERARA